MNAVDPIKDDQKIREIEQKLRAASSRDYLLFTMGINLALRASDLSLAMAEKSNSYLCPEFFLPLLR